MLMEGNQKWHVRFEFHLLIFSERIEIDKFLIVEIDLFFVTPRHT
jgi:hypothetical protein